MIEGIFSELTRAMSGSLLLAAAASFAWGILSILLSPCHLTSIPLIVGYISAQGNVSVRNSFFIALTFSFGIMITIGAIGLITASAGSLLGDIGPASDYIVAGLFFIVGLYLLDVLPLPSFGAAVSKTKLKGLPAALLIGLIFGAALGPCTFAYMAPVLGAVFHSAAADFSYALVLFGAFAIGHCSVIVFAGTLTGKVQKYLNWSESSNAVVWVKRACGVLVLLGGVYYIMGR